MLSTAVNPEDDIFAGLDMSGGGMGDLGDDDFNFG